MTSFVKFLKNEFALKGLEELTGFNGKKYRDLDKVVQRTLKSVTLNTIVLKKESQDLKYEIFARLNQGAVKLKAQELRNCIYRGSFNSLLEKMATDNKYLKELFIEDNKRKNYQEYILRFFALRNFNDYSSSIGKTMNNFMSKHQNDDEKQIEESKKLFNGTIDIIKQVLGKSAFSAYDRQNHCFMNKFSGSVYDSIAIACSMFSSNDLMRHSDKIRKRIEEIKENDQKYSDYTYAATGSKERVIGRIMIIYNAIKEITGKNSNSDVDRVFSNQDKKALWHDNYVCSYCGQTILDIDDAEVDHILPYSLGGETVIGNAQLLHRHCNREKYNNAEIETVNFEDEEN